MRDQIELTRWLHLIAGALDRFDFTALDQNTNTTRSRVDEKVSPRGAVILKPLENLSIYGSYSVSYLPASGDQFSALTAGTLILEPQKFENKEIGVKWNIFPKLLFTAAAYELIRTNVPIADPNNTGFFFPSGGHKIQGFETALKGYVTDAWQTSFGYAYTDARITGSTSTTIVPGNIVQLVPLHQFRWNKYHSPRSGARRSARSTSQFVHHPTTASNCPASSRRRGLYARSTRPGRRSSTSRTFSTRATGPRRTATTTSRPGSRGRSG